MKQNDWFLTSLDNVEMGYTNSDYKAAGMSANNTELLQADEYKKLDEVKNNELFQTNGKFDEQKFDMFYNHTLSTYNELADDTSLEDAMKSVVFFRDDIFAPTERRLTGPQYDYVKINNPDRVTAGIIRMDKWEEPKLTPMEIAESQPIYDPETGKFLDETPESSLFSNFFKPMVLAAWDEDGMHTDPVTGEQVKHMKGELKINPETGTYYAEFLNGRNAYDKQVVHKLDLLTSEGSLMNKFDFFDSDGFEKSWSGSLARNAIMIAPLLVGGPVAATWVAANLGLSLVQLGVTLDKMVEGSDNKTANEIEGFLTSLHSNVSQESQQDMWTAENLINMAGHTFEFLYNMQFIHQKVPALIKGRSISEKSLKEMQNAAQKNIIQSYAARGQNIATNANLQVAAQAQAKALVDNFVKNYQAMGRYISTGYMATTFGAATYNEAKAAGASDTEASIMTLASMAFQYGLLKSHIGSWIFPEAKFDAIRREQAIRILSGAKKATEGITNNKEAKVKWFQNIVSGTKKALQKNYDPTAAGLKGAGAMAVAAGVEMSSFELLHDVSGTLFNFALELNGKKIAKDPMNVQEGEIVGFHPWENMSDRYLSSFIGGAMGGLGLKPWMPFKEARAIKNMTVEDAHRYVIHLIKEGQIDKFEEKINSISLGDTNLSAKKISTADGEIFAPGTKTDNQDLSKKQSIKNLIELYKRALRDNGGIVSDQQLLNAQIMGDVRFGALLKSKVGRKYINKLNDIDFEIASKVKEIEDKFSTRTKLEEGRLDENTELAKDAKEEVNKLKSKLKELVKQKEELLEGKTNYLLEATFEMSPALHMSHGLANFPKYASDLYNGKDFETLTPIEKEIALEKYKKKLDANFEMDFEKSFGAFIEGVKLTSSIIEDAASKTASNLEGAYQNERATLYWQQASDQNKNLGVGRDIAIGNSRRTVYNLIDPYISEFDKQILDKFKYDNWKNIPTDEKIQLIESVIGNKAEPGISILINKLNAYSQTKPYVDSLDINKSNVKDKGRDFIEQYGNEDTIHTFIKNIVSDNIYKKTFNNNYDKILKPFVDSTIVNSWLTSDLMKQLNEWQSQLAEEELQESEIWNSDSIIDFYDKYASTSQTIIQEGIQKFLDSMPITKGINVSEIYEYVRNPNNWETITTDTQYKLDLILNAAEMFRSYIVAANKEGLGLTNPFGFNIIHNKYVEKSLPEIDKNTALKMIGEVNFMIDRLSIYKNAIGSAQKLKTAQETQIAIKMKGEIFSEHKNVLEKMKKLGWGDDLLELESEINACEVLGKGALSLTDVQFKQLIQESIKVETALGKVLSNKTQEQLNELVDTYDVLDSRKTMSDLNMKGVDAHTYVCHLAKITAIPSNDFYAEFKKHISPEIAPLPAQIENIYTMVASLAKPSVMNKFANAWNYSLKQRMHKEKPDFTEARLEFEVQNAAEAIRFKSALSEGIPGAGKTNVVIKLAAIFGPANLTRKVAIVNTTSDESTGTAQKLAKNLGFPENHSYNHEEFASYVLNDYKREETLKMDSLKIENGTVKLNNTIKEESDPYSLIIVDEATHLTDLEWIAIHDYAEKYGARIMSAGDTDQSGIKFNYTVEAFGEEFNFHSDLDTNNFIGSVKLGSSFRTSNNYMDICIDQFRQFKNTSNITASEGLLYYTDQNVGLQGVMVHPDYKSDAVKEALSNMVNALLPGEKIKYLYTSENEFKTYLETGEYKDHIELIKGTAQGLESRFCIYDRMVTNVKESEVDSYLSDVYTALSRSEEGTLLILNQKAIQDKVIISSKQNVPANKSVKSEQIISQYAEKIQNALSDIEGSTIEFEQIGTKQNQPKKDKKQNIKPASQNEENEGVSRDEVGDLESVDNTNGEIEIDNGISESVQEQRLLKANTPKPKTTPKSEKADNIKKEDLPKKDSKDYSLPKIHSIINTETFVQDVYTNATHEDGMLKTPNGYTLSEYSEHRIDGVNGLIKLSTDNNPILKIKLGTILDKLKNNQEITESEGRQIQKILEVISNHAMNEPSLVAISERIQNVLGIENKGYYEYLSIPEWEKMKKIPEDPKFLTGYRSPKEVQFELPEGHGIDAHKTGRHALYYTITDTEGNKLLRVPLIRLPNPDTFAEYFLFTEMKANERNETIYEKQFIEGLREIQDLHQVIESATSQQDRKDARIKQLSIRTNLEDYCIQNSSKAPGLATYAKLSYMFRYSQNSSFKMDDGWVFSEHFENNGPDRSAGDRGNYAGYSGLLYKSTQTPLEAQYSKQDRTVSDIIILNNKEDVHNIKRGYPFVLIGPPTIEKSNLLNYYTSQPNRKQVTVKYLTRPQESVSYYMKYLNQKIYNSSGDYVRYALGNDLTAFQIFKELLSTSEGIEFLQNKYKAIGNDTFMQLDKLQELIQYVDSLETTGEKLNYLAESTSSSNITQSRTFTLQGMLVDLIMHTNKNINIGDSAKFQETVNTNLQELENLTSNIKGIPYKVEAAPANSAWVPSKLPVKFINAEGQERQFSLNVKVDSASYEGDLSVILDTAINKIRLGENNMLYSTDDIAYYENSINQTSSEPSMYIKFIGTDNQQWLSFIKDYTFTSQEKFTEDLNSEGYINFIFNSKRFVIDKLAGYEDYSISNIDLQGDSIENYKNFIVTLTHKNDPSTYKNVKIEAAIIEENGEAKQLKLTPIPDEIQQQTEGYIFLNTDGVDGALKDYVEKMASGENDPATLKANLIQELTTIDPILYKDLGNDPDRLKTIIENYKERKLTVPLDQIELPTKEVLNELNNSKDIIRKALINQLSLNNIEISEATGELIRNKLLAKLFDNDDLLGRDNLNRLLTGAKNLKEYLSTLKEQIYEKGRKKENIEECFNSITINL